MKDRTPVSDVLIPAFVAMVLFWPVAIAALWQAPQLVPLVLAIGHTGTVLAILVAARRQGSTRG